MDKNGNELLKQAISEGLSLRFQDEIDGCTEEIVCSRRHKRAMAAILRGDKADGKLLSPKLRKIIVILVAALLVLASCAVVYKIGVRDIVESVKEFFIGLSYSEDEPDGSTIDEVYELTYIPEGYVLESSHKTSSMVRYEFYNSIGYRISFDQYNLNSTNFYVDGENGYTENIDIKNYEVYYRKTNSSHYYFWNDGIYAMTLISDTELPSKELQLIIEGITSK